MRAGLAAPPDQEALRDRRGPVDLALRQRRAARAARGLRDERQRHHRGARQVVARVCLVDVDQRLQAPFRPQHGQRGLRVDARVARADGERMRLGGREPGLERAVDEQAPDLLERDAAHQLLDVDAAVAQGAAVAVGLSDLGGEGDHALEPGLDLDHVRSLRAVLRAARRCA
jgi:hypothetical protein